MKKTPLALALLLSSPWVLAQEATNATAPTLGVGASVRGEITTANRINYSDGSRSIVYAIDLQAGQGVSFETSGALCAQLFVMREGEPVAGPTQTACGEGAASARLAMVAGEAGRYDVAVSGSGARAYGPFRLEAKPLQVHRGEGPLRPGADIADLMGRDGKSYRLEIRETGYYQIDMRSTDFDSALELEGAGVTLSDDDGGGDLHARLSAPLEAGTYTVRAKSVDAATGLFQLTVGTGALPDGVRLRNSGALPLDGSDVYGALTGSPREYQLRVRQAGRVVIELGSESFDTQLELRGNGLSLSDDDGGGNGTDSRLAAVLQPGTYTVVARALNDTGSGLFQLSASQTALPAGTALRSGGTLSLGATATGLMGTEAHRYQLAIAEAGPLVIDLRSEDFDTVLELRRDDELVAEDDDGGGDTHARISTEVQPGTYTVVAKMYEGGNGGLYELTARRAGE